MIMFVEFVVAIMILTILAGLIIEVMSVAYLVSSLRDAFAFGLMILILVLRPRGLFQTGIRTER